MKFKFTMQIMQKGIFDETLEVVQEFDSALELAQALAIFAAQNSADRLSPSVREIYTHTSGKKTIDLPKAKEGYGPDTSVVIKKVEEV